MALEKYKKKRAFDQTPEPAGAKAKPAKSAKKLGLEFVVQKHQASHLHYDFRLEHNGVLLSWAVPKGPSMNPQDKRLAMMVEDHPFEYRKFHGTIPAGNYGAGTVEIWDKGEYAALGANSRQENERLIGSGLHKGHISFVIYGEKLKGEFALIKTRGTQNSRRAENSWLLVKADDQFAIQQNDSAAANGQPKLKAPGKPAKFPVRNIAPMLAKLADQPFDGKDWIFEIKWDGYRTIAKINAEDVQLYSRNNISFTGLYDPVVQALKKLGRQAILDGEMVIIDQQGKPSFQLLQNYKTGESGRPVYCLFDIIFLDGRDLRSEPLVERKKILAELTRELQEKLGKTEKGLVKYSDHIENKGRDFFKAAQAQNLEGIMAKNKDSHYYEGKRSSQWLKIKTHQRQEAVIGGFTAPQGSRQKFGALILGVYERGKLRYIGHTGGGFNQKNLQKTFEQLARLVQDKSPFSEKFSTNSQPTWVKPQLVCEVEFREWTASGHMRQPIFVGMREDKNAKQVIKEQPEKIKIMANQPKLKTARPKTAKPKIIEPEVTHANKIFWPNEKFTKGDVAEYYRAIAKYLLPYLKDRPESLNRYPNGIAGQSFFQKDMDHQAPDWVKTELIHSESEDRDLNYMLCQDLNTLIYMVNLGCIEINPWNSRTGHLDNPDYLVIDLDPEKIEFKYVIKTAQMVKKILDKIGAKSLCKTSGATGLHIYVPLGGKYSYDQAKDFAHLVAILVNRQLPEITSLERSPKKRQHKIYLDYLQNRRGQTLAAAYSLRPRPGAPVSTPLKWPEVKAGLDPKKFNIKNTLQRLKKTGDLWKGTLGPGIDLQKCLAKIQKLLE